MSDPSVSFPSKNNTLTLRTATSSDAPAILRQLQNPHISSYLDYINKVKLEPTLESCRDRIARCAEDASSRLLTIVSNATGEIVGEGEFENIDQAKRMAEVGVLVDDCEEVVVKVLDAVIRSVSFRR